jgi:type IV secretion system protein TrbF
MSFSDAMRSLVMKKPAPAHANRVALAAVEGGAGRSARPVRKSSTENPYFNARRTWNDQAAANIAARQMWQILGVLALLIALGSLAGMVVISKQSKVIPFLVEVDKLGHVQAAGVAQQVGPIDPRIEKALLGEWIGNIRMVTADAELQRKAIFKVYAMLHAMDPAYVKVNEFLNADEKKNPFKRAETQLVEAEVDSLLQQTPTSWQVEWTETTRDRNGTPQGPAVHWRALITVTVIAPASDAVDKSILDNPLGIYIKDFSWTAVG